MNLEDWLKGFKHIGDECLRNILQKNERPTIIQKRISKKEIKRQKHSFKQPKSSYMLYWLKRSQELRKLMPNHDLMFFPKIISQEWNNLSATEKIIYENQSTMERERYWQQLGQISSSECSKSDFHHFWYKQWNEIIKKNPHAQILETLKCVQLKWKNMTKQEKEVQFEYKQDYCGKNQQYVKSDQDNLDLQFNNQNQISGVQSNNLDEDSNIISSHQSDLIQQQNDLS